MIRRIVGLAVVAVLAVTSTGGPVAAVDFVPIAAQTPTVAAYQYCNPGYFCLNDGYHFTGRQTDFRGWGRHSLLGFPIAGAASSVRNYTGADVYVTSDYYCTGNGPGFGMRILPHGYSRAMWPSGLSSAAGQRGIRCAYLIAVG